MTTQNLENLSECVMELAKCVKWISHQAGNLALGAGIPQKVQRVLDRLNHPSPSNYHTTGSDVDLEKPQPVLVRDDIPGLLDGYKLGCEKERQAILELLESDAAIYTVMGVKEGGRCNRDMALDILAELRLLIERAPG